jgi:hypothetical protein
MVLMLVHRLSASAGLPLYMNECDAEQNVFATYGQYEFLKQVYKKYDPTGYVHLSPSH